MILYSTDCPKCKVLEKKLALSGVAFTVNRDVEEMNRLGLLSAPALSVDGELMDFAAAVQWASGQKE